jgi:hypothetical protein
MLGKGVASALLKLNLAEMYKQATPIAWMGTGLRVGGGHCGVESHVGKDGKGYGMWERWKEIWEKSSRNCTTPKKIAEPCILSLALPPFKG